MTYVVQVSQRADLGLEPDSVMAAMAQTVVYADPSTDITKDVVYNLNQRYKAAGRPPRPKAAAPVGDGPGRGRRCRPKPAGN